MGSNPALDISYISQTGGAVSLFRRFVAGLSPQTPGFNFRSVYLGFLVDRVALGQIFFSEGFGFVRSAIVQPVLCCH